jgi:hypothetical protein
VPPGNQLLASDFRTCFGIPEEEEEEGAAETGARRLLQQNASAVVDLLGCLPGGDQAQAAYEEVSNAATAAQKVGPACTQDHGNSSCGLNSSCCRHGSTGWWLQLTVNLLPDGMCLRCRQHLRPGHCRGLAAGT